MTIDYSILANEINIDPLNLGYSQYITMGSDYGISVLLNNIIGNGSATITLPTMSNSDFVAAFLPYLPAALKSSNSVFYSTIWQTILAMPIIDFTKGTVDAVMAEAVSDGVMTQAQATALNQRMGSRAEVLFGAGIIIDHLDIAKSLRG